MALRYAVANGNWSSTSTWDGGTLPTSVDDVYSNNFTVTVDQNVTVLSLRNTAGAPAVGGGKFLLTNLVTVNATGTGLVSGSVTLLEFNLSSPNSSTVNYTLINSASNSNLGAILLSGTGTLNCNGNFQGDGVTNTIFRIQANGTLNLIGNCISYVMNSGNAIGITALSATLNWTGNMPGNYRNANNWGFIAGPGNNVAGVQTTSTINITGNLINSDTTGGPGILTNGICNVIGTITPIVSSGIFPAVINGGAGSNISVIGIVNGNNNRNLAISTSGLLTISGQINCVNEGFPFGAGRLRLSNSTPTQITFQTDSAGVNKTLYEPGTSLGNPAITDVRNGTTYASGSLTGTLKVPSASSVAVGVPVDNTTGTAIISISDMGALLASYSV
jgi:hypothetical protein